VYKLTNVTEIPVTTASDGEEGDADSLPAPPNHTEVVIAEVVTAIV